MAYQPSMFYTGPALSSACDTWGTPADLFAELDAEFHFETDVCALPSNAKCERYFTPEEDGLAQDWTGVCWMNPPYGRSIGQWVRKAFEAGRGGATVVCLLPSRTDTAWWHDYCMRGDIRFLRGRLKFERGECSDSAPFPSAIVVFDRMHWRGAPRLAAWDWRRQKLPLCGSL